MRYRVVEELVELAGSPDDQIAHFRRRSMPLIELTRGCLNWSYDMLPVLERRGALSAGVLQTTNAVSEALLELDRETAVEYEQTGKIRASTEQGIREDPRWESVRELAREALVAFRALGVPTPSLTDDDFNAPRDDAP
jgi:hypothetical protein